MSFLFIFIILIACKANDASVIVKKEATTDPVISEPELIEEETKADDDPLIEFSLPYEQVVINLKMVPILDDYLRLIDNKINAIEQMNLIPIHSGSNTIYLLEFSCQNDLCSYLVIDQSKDNQTYLVADLAKYVSTSIAPDQTKMIITFDRHTSLSTPRTNLVAIDLENWEILSLKAQSDDHDFLNYHWPITSVTWINEQTISAHIPVIDEPSEANILEWENSGSQTTDIIFQIEK